MADENDDLPLDVADDRIIAGRAADGDPEAFRVLVRRYAPLMLGYARRILGATDEVDDVVQEAFITAWQRLPELEEPAAVRSWLMRITSHKAISRVRARRPRLDVAEVEPASPETATPQRIVESRSQLEELSAALNELPDAQRQCWVLREVAGYSYDEIAEELGVPPSTVRGLLARARKFLVVRMEAWR